jgi:predicted N-acetyltransferase YhbS
MQHAHIRPARADDAEQCGRICYEAFAAIADRHAFPRDFPAVEAATAACSFMIGHPQFFGVVAELDGRVVGSNFLDARSTIYSVGPITVQPRYQDRQVGRQLMSGCSIGPTSLGARCPAGAGRLSQSLAEPVHHAGFRRA